MTLRECPPEATGIRWDEWRKKAIHELFERFRENPNYPKGWNETRERQWNRKKAVYTARDNYGL